MTINELRTLIADPSLAGDEEVVLYDGKHDRFDAVQIAARGTWTESDGEPFMTFAAFPSLVWHEELAAITPPAEARGCYALGGSLQPAALAALSSGGRVLVVTSQS